MPKSRRKVTGIDKIDRGDGLTRLHRAARDGHHAIVNSLLKDGADINKGGCDLYEGRTALTMASYHGHQRVVELLLLRGADIHKETSNGLNALHFAAIGGHANIVKIFLNKGLDLQSCGLDGLTPLHRAKNYAVAELLISRGADVNAASRSVTPIMSCSDPQVAELLLRHGARITDVDNRGENPLHHAAANGYLEMVNFLIDQGADIEARSVLGTPLMTAIHYYKYSAAKILVSKGADVNRISPTGFISLHFAASNWEAENQVELLEELIKAGAVIDARDLSGNTPLHIAGKFSNVIVAKWLIRKGADTTLLVSDTGYTFLAVAAKHWHFDFIEEFLSKEYSIPVSYYREAFQLLIVSLMEKKNLMKEDVATVAAIYEMFMRYRSAWEKLLQAEDVAVAIYMPASNPIISSPVVSEHPVLQRAILNAVPGFLVEYPVMNHVDGMNLYRQLNWSARSAFIYLLSSMHTAAKSGC